MRLTTHLDWARALNEKDPTRALYHQGQIDLLTPIFKAYATDQAFQVAATAIQTYGGAGFLRDHPVEQYCRDAKIFSIYEGTNHIQALDLIGRKLRQQGGKPVFDFLGEVGKLLETQAKHPRFAASVAELAKAHAAVGQVLGKVMEWGKAGDRAMPQRMANHVLEMLAEVAVAALLLEGALIAHDRLPAVAAGHPDHAFYEGKCMAAIYYALNVLPGVRSKADIVMAADRSPLDIADDAFASVD